MDLGEWLRGLGLSQYEATFREHEIDADVLPDLTEADLEKIGLPLGARKRLMKGIAGLASKGALPSTGAPAPPPETSARARLQQMDLAERRPVTVMFCDLVGSTALASRLDAEDWRSLLNAYLDEASAAVTGLGGHVLKRLGDGLMALFGYPSAQENDAERAVRAALAIQRALADLNARNSTKNAPELSARIGLESGPVVVEATGEVFGDAPNVAARVQAAADPGSVLVTRNVQLQVAGLFVVEERGPHELKGLPEPVQLFRIIRASGAGRRGGARSLTPFVGRDEELGLLARRWERARTGEGQLVLIVGEPGLGKSRLTEEFHSQLTETPHTWSEWSASQLLQNTPLHPIAEWGRQRFGVDAPAEHRLADLENTLRLIGLDPAEHAPLIAPLVDIPLPPERAANLPPEELRRRQLAAMTALVLAGARSQPVVLVFEDLHWADPTSLDLLRTLADRGAQAPLLLLATTRPEFRPPWSLRSHHSVISLSPLDRAGVARMVGEISARHAFSKEVIEGVSERTGGVPLFVEEVTRLLLERGEQGGVQAIPPTLQQSLAARLDRLGPAREVAQIGAVLGRDFAYPLLRGVAEADETALRASLDRLTEADLLFVNGAPPQATYRFKHALIQDAAHDSLLKSRRQALHQRAAELLGDDPERAATEPEVIAHHFTQGGLDDLAIEWWGRAGDQALRRSAFQEAIAHLGKAIEMADRARTTVHPRVSDAVAAGQRLKLQTDYGHAVMWSRGFAAAETKSAFSRATELAAKTDDFSVRFTAFEGQCRSAITRGELRSAWELASSFLREAEEAERPAEARAAHRNLGLIAYFRGDFLEAGTHLETALDARSVERQEEAPEGFGDDIPAVATTYLALTSWQLGEVDRARELIDAAHRRAEEIGQVPSKATVLYWRSYLEILRGNRSAALRAAEALAALAQAHAMMHFTHMAELNIAWARGRLHDPTTNAEQFRQALRAHLDHGFKIGAGFYTGLLADLEAETLSAESALARIDQALDLLHQADNRFDLPLLHRIRGDILSKRGPADPAAEDAYQAAIAIAMQQGARSHVLLASLPLAKLYQSTGRLVEAHDILALALEGFAPTPEMPEIAEAQALLAALAKMEEVKVAASQQQRQAQLQVAYGNALIAVRGFGAPETTEAFARAHESASSEKDAPERLAADFGLWAGSYTRGELPSMRVYARTFLADVEARPNSPEAGVAHRLQGVTHWFAGEYREARERLERALALFQPGRDDEMALRFGPDPGVSSMAYLAFACWPLGEIDRAISLIDRMKTQIAGLTHANTLALGKMYAAQFALMCGGRGRLTESALELARIAREYDLAQSRAFGTFFEGWARIESDLPGGLAEMRRGVDSLRARNIVIFDGLVKIALAKTEAHADDADHGLSILDEALATADRLGYRTFEAELHRERGELLFKRDPADLAPAEQAFRTAIAIATEQGARSYELLASLSLAKLYQSAERPAEAHEVLAPALEGFSPTPEMPEIAEAQALLAELVEMDEVKTAVAQQERRLRLEVAYGQAMMWSKGYNAEETKASLARAAELAGTTREFSERERFSVSMGQFGAATTGGELRYARELALTLLRESEDAGWVRETAAANFMLGLVAYWRGDFVEARTRFEQVLTAPDLKPDPKTWQTFDPSTSAFSCLAATMWQLGLVERARELINSATLRASELRDVGPIANALFWKSYLEIWRSDPLATLSAARDLERIAREHGLTQYLSEAELHTGWARGRIDDPTAGATQVRGVLASFVDQGVKVNLGFYNGLLAQLEAETVGAEAALARIDEAFQLSNEVEHHCSVPFLHRLHGEFLLKRDPADLVRAEEAFRTSTAIAKEQSARCPVLLASVALAKLYQSTGRPVDAQAVLAPALEGFSPTLEIPEIAEAQALLSQLA